jgi:hypothetical protein
MININYINTNMKIPRNIQFINGFEMVVEYGVGGGSYLLHVSGYKKMKTLGQIYSHIN